MAPPTLGTLESPDFYRILTHLYLLQCLFGTALTMADGVFTPAVSVTSAVAGIAVSKSSVLNDIVPISIVFLLALFFVQQFGTARLAVFFAPGTFC